MPDYPMLARQKDFAARHKVTITGRGTETVVLGNGFGTVQTAWRKLLPWLEQRYRVVRFDWALESDHFDVSRYTCVEGFANDLLAVLLVARADDCIFIGHSMANMIGVAAARWEPKAFRRMVMLAPAPCYYCSENYTGGFQLAEVHRLLDAIGQDFVSWAAAFAPTVVGPEGGQESIDEFTASLRSMRPDVAYTMALTAFKMDMRDRIGDFTVPTTLIQPRHDPAVPVAVGLYLRDRWPNSRLEIIEACGHYPHMTAPEKVLEVLARSGL